MYIVGGIFGVSFLTAAISQEVKDQLIPGDATAIAAFERSPTKSNEKIFSTSATFSLNDALNGKWNIVS